MWFCVLFVCLSFPLPPSPSLLSRTGFSMNLKFVSWERLCASPKYIDRNAKPSQICNKLWIGIAFGDSKYWINYGPRGIWPNYPHTHSQRFICIRISNCKSEQCIIFIRLLLLIYLRFSSALRFSRRNKSFSKKNWPIFVRSTMRRMATHVHKLQCKATKKKMRGETENLTEQKRLRTEKKQFPCDIRLLSDRSDKTVTSTQTHTNLSVYWDR